jgi:HK97 family phage major capsid protein
MLNIAVLQADLKTKQTAALSLYEKHLQAAEKDNRATTDEERAAVKALVDEAEGIKAQLARAAGDTEQLAAIHRLSNGEGLTPVHAPALRGQRLTMGQQFVKAPEYDFFRKGHHRAQSAWRSPSVELFDMMRATTLTEDPASGGTLLVPQYTPAGIQPLPTRQLVVADLFAQGISTSNAISYMREKTFTNAAAAVLEGAAKPESALIFEAVSDLVRKIAHWLPVSEEMLEDVDQIQSYIDARLRLGVQLKEDDELLNGTGVAPDLDGILHRATGVTVVQAVAPATAADAVFTQIMTLASTSYLMPDGIVMNPADWATIAASKTTTGEYLAGGPFTSIPTATLWGLPVALTPAIVAKTALVGAFKTGAQVFRKGGIRVEASNSHVDFFIKNLVAIRAEERLALAVYRPAAFGKVTLL